MSSSSLPLQNRGIFHNLPTFDASIKNKTAIVTGANGISGFHTLRVLLESPERWTKVWAASRRPPPPEMMALLPKEALSRVEHVACDFLSSPEDIAKQLQDKGVKADAVFFYSYAQPAPKEAGIAWSNAQELADVNSKCISSDKGFHTDINQPPCSTTFSKHSPMPKSLHPGFYSKPGPRTTMCTKDHHVRHSLRATLDRTWT